MGAKWHNVIYWNSLIKEIVANDAYIQLNRKTNHQSVHECHYPPCCAEMRKWLKGRQTIQLVINGPDKIIFAI